MPIALEPDVPLSKVIQISTGTVDIEAPLKITPLSSKMIDTPKRTKVGIIGPGNVGLSIAAFLAKQGFQPLIMGVGTHTSKIIAIKERQNHLQAEGIFSLPFDVEIAEDVHSLVRQTKSIIVATPAHGHPAVIDELCKARDDLQDHVIVAICGCLFSRLAEVAGIEAAFIGETASSPYAARLPNMTVLLKGVKAFLPIAGHVLPEANMRDRIQQLFPQQLKWVPNYLELFLCWNISAIVHVLPAVLNVGWIESDEAFYFYKQGMSDTVTALQMEVDELRVRGALEYGFSDIPRLPTIMNEYYQLYHDNWLEFAQNSRTHNLLKEAPKSISHRYFTQDIPCVFVPLYELLCKVGLENESCLVKACVDVGGVMHRTNYWASGRNLEALGWAGHSKNDILSSLRGVAAENDGRIERKYGVEMKAQVMEVAA